MFLTSRDSTFRATHEIEPDGGSCAIRTVVEGSSMNVKARTAEESPPIAAEQTRRCFVGRQAIFDRKGKVTAYELLFRSGETNRAMIVDSDMATAQVLTNTFMELGVDTVVGDKRAFVNFSRGLLTSQDTSVLPPSRVCIEVLENVAADPELVAVPGTVQGAGIHDRTGRLHPPSEPRTPDQAGRHRQDRCDAPHSGRGRGTDLTSGAVRCRTPGREGRDRRRVALVHRQGICLLPGILPGASPRDPG